MRKLTLYIFLGLTLWACSQEAECTKGDCDNGYGTFTYTDGGTYVGEWSNGIWHGQGTYIAGDGRTYVGEYRDGKRHGQGIYTFANGTVKKGIWKNGELVEPN